jgi:hypothetical protein
MCNIHAGAFSIIDLQIQAKMRFCERILIISSEEISIFFKSESGLQMCCSTAICTLYSHYSVCAVIQHAKSRYVHK